jgi:hypothetical protein
MCLPYYLAFWLPLVAECGADAVRQTLLWISNG